MPAVNGAGEPCAGEPHARFEVAGTWLIIACHAQLRLARARPPTCAAPGNGPPRPGRVTPPASAAGSGTSARKPPSQPAHRNPASPAPAARQDQRTGTQPNATTSEKPPGRNPRSRHGKNQQVKPQGEAQHVGFPVLAGLQQVAAGAGRWSSWAREMRGMSDRPASTAWRNSKTSGSLTAVGIAAWPLPRASC